MEATTAIVRPRACRCGLDDPEVLEESQEARYLPEDDWTFVAIQSIGEAFPKEPGTPTSPAMSEDSEEEYESLGRPLASKSVYRMDPDMQLRVVNAILQDMYRPSKAEAEARAREDEAWRQSLQRARATVPEKPVFERLRTEGMPSGRDEQWERRGGREQADPWRDEIVNGCGRPSAVIVGRLASDLPRMIVPMLILVSMLYVFILLSPLEGSSPSC
ncbi:hypothetical protein DENSPDRAFT_838924 [Dentipellis sp. KUC8613]|nr:hypothetical protein DENSPDRAFT_838924 [Dentipellis sp. KUC8613]